MTIYGVHYMHLQVPLFELLVVTVEGVLGIDMNSFATTLVPQQIGIKTIYLSEIVYLDFEK